MTQQTQTANEYAPWEMFPTASRCGNISLRNPFLHAFSVVLVVGGGLWLWWGAVGRAVVGGGAGEGSSLQQEQLHVLTCQSQLTNQIKL